MARPKTSSPARMATNVPAAFGSEKRPVDDRHHREAIEDQRGRIVGEPLAFQHHQNAARQADLARDRQRRHHVRRRDDGAEQEADRPTAGRSDNAWRWRPAHAVKITQPTASSVMMRRLTRNSRQLMATRGRIDQRRQHAPAAPHPAAARPRACPARRRVRCRPAAAGSRGRC